MSENISAYHKKLVETVLLYSDADEWTAAADEWSIVAVREDDDQSSSCVCGKENLRYLFTIKNTVNGNILYPIGSSCIKKFGRSDLDEEVTVKEQLFRLLHAVEKGNRLELSAKFFSQKLLRYLYDAGAFKPTAYNGYMPFLDYSFMLDMFNKKSRTALQEKKAIAIILNSIKPFLQKHLNELAEESSS